MGKQRPPISKGIHSYLLEKGELADVPKDYNEFHELFKKQNVARNIYRYLGEDEKMGDLPKDFDSFYFGVFPETTLVEAPEDQLPPVQVDVDPAKELAFEGTESVENQMADIIDSEGATMSKPKMLKAMVRQKLAGIEELLAEERLVNPPRNLEFGTDEMGVPRARSKEEIERERLHQAKGVYEQILNMPDHDSDNSAWANFKAGLSSIGLEHIPFVGSIIDIEKNLQLMAAHEGGTAADKALVEAAGVEQMVRQDEDLKPPTGFLVGEGVVAMIPYMAEFAFTGGAYTAAKVSAMKGLTKVLGTKAATKAGKVTTRVAGEMTGAMAQTFANPQTIIKNSIERMTPEYQMIMSADDSELATMIPQDGEEFGEAFAKGLGVTYSEFLTERFGQHFIEAAGKGAMLKFLKKISLSEWATRKGFKTFAETNKAFKKAGWNGVFAETYLEEYPNGLANAFITGDRPLIEALNPASEEMKITLYTMLVMGGAGQSGRAAAKVSKVVGEAQDQLATSLPSYTINGEELSQEAALERIETGEIGGLVINNDPAVEKQLTDKAAVMRSQGLEVPAVGVNIKEQELMADIKAEEMAAIKKQGGVEAEEVTAVPKKDKTVTKEEPVAPKKDKTVTKEEAIVPEKQKPVAKKKETVPDEVEKPKEAPAKKQNEINIEKRTAVLKKERQEIFKQVGAETLPIKEGLEKVDAIETELKKLEAIPVEKKETIPEKKEKPAPTVRIFRVGDSEDRLDTKNLTITTKRAGKLNKPKKYTQEKFDAAVARYEKSSSMKEVLPKAAAKKKEVPAGAKVPKVTKVAPKPKAPAVELKKKPVKKKPAPKKEKAAEVDPAALEAEGKARVETLTKKHPKEIGIIAKSKTLVKAVYDQLAAATKLGDGTAASRSAYDQANIKLRKLAESLGLKGGDNLKIIVDYAKALDPKKYIKKAVASEPSTTTTEGGRKLRKATPAEIKKAKAKQKRLEKAQEKIDKEIENEENFDQFSSEEHFNQEDEEQKMVEAEASKKTRRPAIKPLKTKDGPIMAVAEIMKKLSRFTVPIRYAKKLRKGVAGVYNVKFGTIAIRLENALSVATHEVGHHLQDTYKLVTKAPAAAMQEILWLAKYGSKPPKGASVAQAELYTKGEAVAEFIREWMVNPDAAALHHPAFLAYFEEAVPKKKRDKLREVGNDIRRLFSATPVEAMIANTTLPQKEKDAYLKWYHTDGDGAKHFKVTWWDRVKVTWINDQAVFNKYVKLAMGVHGLDAKEIFPADDPRVAMSLLSGLHSKFDNILANGMVGYDLERLQSTSEGRRMTMRWLMDMFDSSTNDSFTKDKEFAVAWMIAERTREILDREIEGYDDFSTDVILGYMKEHGEDVENMSRGKAINTLLGQKRDIDKLNEELKQRKGRSRKDTEKLKAKRDALAEQNRAIWEGINKYNAKVVAGLGGHFYSDAAEVNRMMGEVEALKSSDPKRYERLKEASRRYREYADATLKYAVEGGRMAKAIRAKAEIGDTFEKNGVEYERISGGWSVDGDVVTGLDAVSITKEWEDNQGELIGGYDYVKEHNNYYVAMNRIMDNQADEDWGSAVKTISVARGPGSAAKITMRLKGSGKPIIDPYESLLDNMYRTVSETDNNNVRRSFAELIIGEGIYADKYGVEPRKAVEGGIPVKGQKFERAGVKPIGEALVPSTGSVGENKLVVFKNGQKFEYHVPNGDLFAAFKQLSPSSNGLAKTFMRLKKIIQLSITMSPQFAARNFLRDIQSRYILGISTPKSDLSVIKSPGDGWESALDLFGGGQFGYYDRTQKELYEEIENDVKAQLISDIGSGKVVLAKTKRVFRKYKDALAQSEKFNRAAEFKARYAEGIKKGMDTYNAQMYAAYKSRGLIDFARGGTVAKIINQYVPFFNAGIQGLVAAGRAIQERPVEMLTRLLVMNLVPAVIEQALIESAGDDKIEDYNQLPAYQKDMFYNIAVGGSWVTIPKPFELGLLGSAISREWRGQNGDKNAWDGFGGSAMHSLIPPLAGGFAMYTGGARPLLEVAMNKDTFRGRSIVSERDKPRKLSARNYDRSSALGTYIGENSTALLDALGMEVVVDPRQIDHLVKGYTTYMGTMTLGAIDEMVGKENTQYRKWTAVTGLIKDTSVWGARDVQRTLELAGRDPVTSGIASSMMEQLKFYSLLPEGKQKEAYKQTIFTNAKVLRKVLEDIYD